MHKIELTQIDIENWRFVLWESSDGKWFGDFVYSPESFVDLSLLMELTEEEKTKAIDNRSFLIDLSEEIRNNFKKHLHRQVERNNYSFLKGKADDTVAAVTNVKLEKSAETRVKRDQELPEVVVYISSLSKWMFMLFSIFLFALGIIIIQSEVLLGCIVLGISTGGFYLFFTKYKDNSAQLSITPSGIRLKDAAVIPWENIKNPHVISERTGRRLFWYIEFYYWNEAQEALLHQKMELVDPSIKPARIQDLLITYKTSSKTS